MKSLLITLSIKPLSCQRRMKAFLFSAVCSSRGKAKEEERAQAKGWKGCLGSLRWSFPPHLRLTPITMQSIHITTLRKILYSPEPIDIRLWTRSGEIQSWHRCISLKYDFYKGTRWMKLLDSNEIRQLRAVRIFEVNGRGIYVINVLLLFDSM